jgi:HEPN domain-containing protein
MMEHSDEDIDAKLNDFAKRSFRDVADQDYIAARMSYRANLREPFLWSSLQALEKYFKAILLFNRKSSKGVGHKLDEALIKVEPISDLSFSIPNDVREFIKYINEYGTNRYLEYPSHLQDDALMLLDKSVWYLRCFCYSRNEFRTIPDENNPHQFALRGGFLEEVIKSEHSSSKYLIWHNFFYGRKRTNIIKNNKMYFSFVTPTLAMYPEIFGELDKLVFISPETRKYFKNLPIQDIENIND